MISKKTGGYTMREKERNFLIHSMDGDKGGTKDDVRKVVKGDEPTTHKEGKRQKK